MSSLHTQDWVSIASAFGTCVAAFFSWRAVRSANKVADSAEKERKENAERERVRWLASLMSDMANRCNLKVKENGKLMDEKADLSSIVTAVHDAVEFVNSYTVSNDEQRQVKMFLWKLLHTSVRGELRECRLGKRYDDATLNEQYAFVQDNLVDVVN
ncbi:hypothetical protein [Serratia rubidaea]|uniref:hypothetical protein n=1 Tax=Serratia rubidaea TaxID=61652 RepID=UPI003FA359BA